jgi:hypothetical protein
MPISAAPAATSMVPTSEYRVKGSPRTTVAHIVLKTSPDFLLLLVYLSFAGCYSTYRLQGRQHRQRQGRYLYATAHNI